MFENDFRKPEHQDRGYKRRIEDEFNDPFII